MKNIGWLFYKNYYDFKSLYRSIRDNQDDKTEEEITVGFFNTRNEIIFKSEFIPTNEFKVESTNNIALQTTYPGLLSGSGVTHETGKKGELKLGFTFDHTTGLPYLPGSTVKGAIRQVFPNHLRKKALKIENLSERNKIFEKAKALELYCLNLIGGGITPVQLFQLEWMIFEGKTIENINDVFLANEIMFSKINEKSIPIYESDIFHDAYIEESKLANKLFLDRDFITPHSNPLKNPIPVQFLKVLPKVNWVFQFDLKNTKINESLSFKPDQKRALFKEILLEFGIGAKTNVGYGQFKET